MQAIFILIRFPFYCVGIILFTVLGVPFGLLIGFYWILILPPLWLLFVVPFVLVISAFENNAKEFKEFFSSSVTRWWEKIAKAPTDFLEVYAAMTKWLLGVKHDK